ncbi:threonine/serine exporter family protein [Lacisediminihabitans sp. FW035]
MASSARSWLARRIAGVLKSAVADSPVSADQLEARDVLNMLDAFALALVETGQATNDVEQTLYAIAKTYDLSDLTAVVLPTFVILQSASARGDVLIQSAATSGNRLDQTGAVEVLVAQALRKELAPREAVRALQAAMIVKPRFGKGLALLGHIILTVGFGMVINPTAAAIPAYAILGAGVGGLVLLSRRFAGLVSAVPVVAAFAVTIVTALWLGHLVGDTPLRIIAPPLVSFLPGMTLTIAAIELSSNQVISGASRLVFGVGQLLLLTFGVFAAATVVGGLHSGGHQPALGWWAGLVGVALVALGFTLFMSAPKGAFLWLVLALAVCYGAQALGVLALGAALSGFVGALVVAPFARFATRFRTAPPASVMSLACFWLLVPGALGFIGLSGVSEGQSNALHSLTSAGISVLAVALGAIVGISVSRDAGRLGRLAGKTFRRVGR